MAKYVVNEQTKEIFFFIPIKAEDVTRIITNLGERYSDYFIGTLLVPKTPPAPPIDPMMNFKPTAEA